ncbi:MAG: UbiH/UbiF/VisC/COQ6 family ubiquinone biosynthesis hydroxylase [Pseudomonadota bacterium]
MVTTTTHRGEVAIVGGGLVGPALAIALSRLEIDVLLIDRLAEPVRRDPDFDGRGYAVALGSSGVLGALGLWDELEGLAEPIRSIRVSEGRAGDCPPGQVHFDPAALQEGRVGWILEDRWLRRALLDAVEAAPGIRHLAPAEVVAASFDGPVATLDLADGGRVSAGLVIAADGRQSRIAGLGGLGRQVLSYDQSGLVAAITHERPHDGVAWQSFFPGGPFAVLPLPDGPDGAHRSGLVWSERRRAAERLMALDDRAYEVELARRIGARLGRVTLAGARRAHPLNLTLADRYVRPRLALVGDAAHGVHPIAGQGFNLGLRDVAALAEVLAGAVRNGEDPGDTTVLRRYEAWRRPDNVTFALGMDSLNRLFSTASPVLAALRTTGLAAVDRQAGLKRFFMRQAAGLSVGRTGPRPAMLSGALP